MNATVCNDFTLKALRQQSGLQTDMFHGMGATG
jgi:hypothetical protein